MRPLEENLRQIAQRKASVRADAYQMLEIVTGVIGELEDPSWKTRRSVSA